MTETAAQYQADLKALEEFERVPEEGVYDRVLGVARNAKSGEVEAIIRTKPDGQNQTRDFVKPAYEIKKEIRHDTDARNAPGADDPDMKRDGLTDEQIISIHGDNQKILKRADRMIAQADPSQLPTTEEAIAKYNAPGYKPPAVDSDYVDAPAFTNEPAYTGVKGIARNMDGEPVALVTPASGDKPVAMTEENLLQQISHDNSAQENPGMQDLGMRNDLRGKGLNADDVDHQIVDLHRNNQMVLNSALEQMHDKLASGAELDSIPEAVGKYQEQASNPVSAPSAQVSVQPVLPQPSIAP